MRDGEDPSASDVSIEVEDPERVLRELRRSRRNDVATRFRAVVSKEAHRVLSDGFDDLLIEVFRDRWHREAERRYTIPPATPDVVDEAREVVDDIVDRSRRRYSREE
jgi:hypothetical protein